MKAVKSNPILAVRRILGQEGAGGDAFGPGEVETSLRAGVPGLSENIRLRSILGRFLEHSRLFAFANGGAEEVWIGSADLMHRNLDRRVEVLVQLTSPESLAEIRSVRDLVFSDRVKAWRQMPDGDWVRETVDADGNPLKDVQEELIRSKRRGAAKR